MGGTRIDYSELTAMLEPPKGRGGRRRGPGRASPLRLLGRAALWVVAAACLAVLPFLALIRVGVHAASAWGFGPWPSLLAAMGATGVLLLIYGWVAGRRLGVGPGMRKVLTRGFIGLGMAWAVYAVVYLGAANAKTEEVRAEYRSLHPILRVAASTLFLADPARVMTDASRTEEDYWLMGLPVNEASLHFPQDDGYVRALDLRTRGRPEWGNRAVELAFWALGFHALRHVGTADHLHVSLRPGGAG